MSVGATSNMPLTRNELIKLKHQIDPDDYLVVESGSERILVLRSAREFPDIVNDLEGMINKLDIRDTNELSYALIIGSEEVVGVPLDAIQSLVDRRIEDDERIAEDLTEKLIEPFTTLLFESEDDPLKTLRLGIRITGKLEDLKGPQLPEMLFSKIKSLPRKSEVIYIIADDGYLRMSGTQFYRKLMEFLRENPKKNKELANEFDYMTRGKLADHFVDKPPDGKESDLLKQENLNQFIPIEKKIPPEVTKDMKKDMKKDIEEDIEEELKVEPEIEVKEHVSKEEIKESKLVKEREQEEVEDKIDSELKEKDELKEKEPGKPFIIGEVDSKKREITDMDVIKNISIPDELDSKLKSTLQISSELRSELGFKPDTSSENKTIEPSKSEPEPRLTPEQDTKLVHEADTTPGITVSQFIDQFHNKLSESRFIIVKNIEIPGVDLVAKNPESIVEKVFFTLMPEFNLRRALELERSIDRFKPELSIIVGDTDDPELRIFSVGKSILITDIDKILNTDLLTRLEEHI
jgi:hypothetical protein